LAGGGVLLFLILLSKETGVRNRILAAIASALCVAGVLFVPAQAASGAPHPGLVFQLQEGHWGSLCDNASPRLCARDPSDGGLGTQIKMSNYSGDNAMQWKPVRATMCGGTVGNNCPDLALSQRYPNDPIYYFVNRGSGDCLGANSASVWVVVMKTCDDTDTLFVYNLVDNGCSASGSSLYCYTVSVRYAFTFDGGIAWLCGDTAPDGPALVDPNCSSHGQAQWG
jgi:hypothetical protein